VRKKVASGKLRVESRKRAHGRSGSQFSTLNSKLKRIRLLLTDVDGVLTDGSVFITSDGEFKQFSIQDGFGLVLWRKLGFKTGWISARPSGITARRAAELQIDYLVQDKLSKTVAAEKILKQSGLNWSQVCFVGDDVVDLCLLKRAGVAVAVANGIDEVKSLADYVTRARGGHGAVREVITMILKAQGKWQPLIREFMA
jgi:3-deoxy-D-manno-octulosonate 8-phosphate phosphatase (KDO 8-P phosphatase)